jgi:glucose/arabinose dehydrogenase
MHDHMLARIIIVVAAIVMVEPAPALALPRGFSLLSVAAGLDQPTAFAIKGAKILVTEKASGKVQVVLPDGSLRPRPFVTLKVNSDSERGVLGIALDPSFSTNRFVYIYYTTGPGALGYTGSPKNRVSRFSSTAPGLVGFGETIIIDNIPSDAGNHNGGDIQFGFDGMLYVAVGDGGQFHGDAQTLNTLRGKMPARQPRRRQPQGQPVPVRGRGAAVRRPGRRAPRRRSVQRDLRTRSPQPVSLFPPALERQLPHRRRRPEHVGGAEYARPGG